MNKRDKFIRRWSEDIDWLAKSAKNHDPEALKNLLTGWLETAFISGELAGMHRISKIYKGDGK